MVEQGFEPKIWNQSPGMLVVPWLQGGHHQFLPTLDAHSTPSPRGDSPIP